jgi:hypothetical protein
VQRREYGTERERERERESTLHRGELNNLHSSTVIIRMMNSMTMKLAEYVAYMRPIRDSYTFLLENKKERDHLLDLSVDGRIVLSFMLNK